VAELLVPAIPVTVELVLLSQIIALLIAVPLGMYSALRPHRLIDRITMVASFSVLSIPGFVLGLALIYMFALRLVVLPATGYVPIATDPLGNVTHILLPSITLALPSAVVYLRVLRSDMIATLQEDFIIAARAKGLPTWHVLFRHALPPSSLSMVTLVGLTIGRLLSGAVIVEWMFALPGLGNLLVSASAERDYPLIQGCVVIFTVGFVFVNFLVDTLYPLLDPRVRIGAMSRRFAGVTHG
jgi:peptide/nickel transport system permease protein